MIKYRPQRGSLDDSMCEAKSFNSINEMIDFIVKQENEVIPSVSPGDIVISENSISDNRIGWNDCHKVLAKRCGCKNYDIPQCIGYCNIK